MGEFVFGSHEGHLHLRADQIARKHGARHINYTENDGRRRGWFVLPNQSPEAHDRAKHVLAAIEQAGGLEALTYRQDRGSQ